MHINSVYTNKNVNPPFPDDNPKTAHQLLYTLRRNIGANNSEYGLSSSHCPANGIFNIISNIYFPSHVSGCLPVALLWLHYGQIETPRIVVAIESMDGYGKSIHLHLIEAHFDRVLDGLERQERCSRVTSRHPSNIVR